MGFRVRHYFLFALFLAALLLLPTAGDAYVLRLGTIACMYAILAASWNVVGGMTGYPSFAMASFFGLGAYTSALLVAKGIPLYLTLPAAGLLGFSFAFALGIILLRLKGHYFAIASLATVEVLREIANSATGLTGGGMGLNVPRIAEIEVFAEATIIFYLMWGLLTVTAIGGLVIEKTKLGFGLTCIRQSENAAETLGLNIRLYKALAFGISAITSAMAGGLYASWVAYIEPSDVFDILYTIKPVVMALIGGVGSTIGAVAGAFIYIGVEEIVWHNFLEVSTGLLGLLIVILLLFLPRGIGTITRFKWKSASA
jgi:branched-chain amino acid transport system permease protein